jgi:hypothetical protein
MEDLVEIILWAIAGYLLVGVLFYVIFWLRLKSLFGSHVTHSNWGFFIISAPSLIALWPTLVVPCLKSTEFYPYPGGGADRPTTPGQLRKIQPFLWLLLIFLVPIGLALAIHGRAPEAISPQEYSELSHLVKEGAK